MDKQWWKSKTIIGIIISILGKVAAVGFGMSFTDAQVVQMTDAVATIISLSASLVGDVLATYGRVQVGKKVSK